MRERIVVLIALLFFSVFSFAQTNNQQAYERAVNLFNTKDYLEAYKAFKLLRFQIAQKDDIYSNVLQYFIKSATELEKSSRLNQDFSQSLNYGLEVIGVLREARPGTLSAISDSELWMSKNLAISYAGIGNFTEANSYKQILYQRNMENNLPMGLTGYFNFDFFKVGDKNVWGYEWYEDPFSERVTHNFSKIIYFVYNTNSDGTDKSRIYRVHLSKTEKDGFVLEKQWDRDGSIIAGKLEQYPFDKEIDFRKLRKDVATIVLEGTEPLTERKIEVK